MCLLMEKGREGSPVLCAVPTHLVIYGLGMSTVQEVDLFTVFTVR